MVVSILAPLIVVIGILTALGCCIIPCVRGLAQRLSETAISKQMPLKPPPYSESRFLLEDLAENPRERECENTLSQLEGGLEPHHPLRRNVRSQR